MQAATDALVLVVDRRIKPQVIHEPLALLGTSGDSDDERGALALGDLPGDGSDGAGRAGHHDRVALAQVADLGEAEVRGQARHAQAAQVGRERRRVRVDLGNPPVRDDGLLLDTELANDVVTGCEAVAVRFHHHGRGAGAHHVSQADRREVRGSVVHPSTHRRIERDLKHLDKYFAVARRRRFLLGDVEIVRSWFADGALREAELSVHAP